MQITKTNFKINTSHLDICIKVCCHNGDAHAHNCVISHFLKKIKLIQNDSYSLLKQNS